MFQIKGGQRDNKMQYLILEWDSIAEEKAIKDIV